MILHEARALSQFKMTSKPKCTRFNFNHSQKTRFSFERFFIPPMNKIGLILTQFLRLKLYFVFPCFFSTSFNLTFYAWFRRWLLLVGNSFSQFQNNERTSLIPIVKYNKSVTQRQISNITIESQNSYHPCVTSRLLNT